MTVYKSKESHDNLVMLMYFQNFMLHYVHILLHVHVHVMYMYMSCTCTCHVHVHVHLQGTVYNYGPFDINHVHVGTHLCLG